MKRETRHIPVLLHEVLHALNPRPGQIIVDCTLGLAGHSSEILKRLLPPSKKKPITPSLIAIDFDPHNIALAEKKLLTIDPTHNHFAIFHNNFAALPTILAQLGIEKIHGLVADLGVASPQIDDPARGFSYKKPGPLDMRMDPTRGQPASTLVNRLSEQQIAEALLELGDETDAPKIARAIVERRAEMPIETTQDLMAIVCHARDFTLTRAAGAKLHPAARTFQALRILVNRELANLEHLLKILPDILAPNGTATLISFHSGEDRPIKKSFQSNHRAGIYSQISPDPILATESEILQNPRSRSAKLRTATRA